MEKSRPELDFDSDAFDPIAFINNKFPNEDSLVNLDEELEIVQKEVNTLEEELISGIESHALMQKELKEETAKANLAAFNLTKEIGTIKLKAEKSEEIVEEMCKDIKALDIAKRNLTFSITALKKFLMMLTALEKLREACEAKAYHEISSLLGALDELVSHFKNFESVPQLSDLFKEKKRLLEALEMQISEDIISHIQERPDSPNLTKLSAVSSTIELLGSPFKNKLIQKICQEVSGSYKETFSGEQGKLENTERRYAWIMRVVKEFEEKFNGLFPHYWGLSCFLLYEFCCLTRIQLSEILQRKSPVEVTLLIKTLQSTIKFEKRISDEVTRDFGGYAKENQNLSGISKDFAITLLPKYKGSISDCFERFLGPYVEKEEADLNENLTQFLQQDESENSGDLKVLNSSLYLFNYVKTLIKRASAYSSKQTMLDILRVIKNGFNRFAEELVMKISRTEGNKIEVFIPFVVNTAEYCKETLAAVLESVKKALSSPYNEQVTFESEEDKFKKVLNKGIDFMVSSMETKLEPEFQAFGRILWDKVVIGDASDYVKNMKAILSSNIKMIQANLNELYFTLFLNRLVPCITGKYLSNLFKCKKIGDSGIQQLQLDIYVVKTEFLNLGKVENVIPPALNSIVNKSFSRLENVLKAIPMSTDQLVSNFKAFFPDVTTQESDLERILTLKGIKKADATALIKSLNLK